MLEFNCVSFSVYRFLSHVLCTPHETTQNVSFKFIIITTIFSVYFQVTSSGNFELQILEISNTNSHLLSGYCCGVPSDVRSTRTTGCPPCATSFRLCLKEYQQTASGSLPGVLSGCSFGNASSDVIGASSFVLTDPEAGSLVLPFSFRWTVSRLFSFYVIYSYHLFCHSFRIAQYQLIAYQQQLALKMLNSFLAGHSKFFGAMAMVISRLSKCHLF